MTQLIYTTETINLVKDSDFLNLIREIFDNPKIQLYDTAEYGIHTYIVKKDKLDKEENLDLNELIDKDEDFIEAHRLAFIFKHLANENIIPEGKYLFSYEDTYVCQESEYEDE